MFQSGILSKFKVISVEEYNTLSSKDKAEYISIFAKYASTLHEYSCDSSKDIAFNEVCWSKLSLDLKLALFYSLRDLDKDGVVHKHKVAKLYVGGSIDSWRSNPWHRFAEHMVPRLIDELFMPRAIDDQIQERHKKFLTTLAQDSYYASLIKPSGYYGSHDVHIPTSNILPYGYNMMDIKYHVDRSKKYDINIVSNLLNSPAIEQAFILAGNTVNANFFIETIRLRYESRVNSEFFLAALNAGLDQLLVTNKYHKSVIATSIVEILKYLNEFWTSDFEIKLLHCFKEKLTAHFIKDRSIADCFAYNRFGIILPGDEQPSFFMQKVWNSTKWGSELALNIMLQTTNENDTKDIVNRENNQTPQLTIS